MRRNSRLFWGGVLHELITILICFGVCWGYIYLARDNGWWFPVRIYKTEKTVKQVGCPTAATKTVTVIKRLPPPAQKIDSETVFKEYLASHKQRDSVKKIVKKRIVKKKRHVCGCFIEHKVYSPASS